MTFERPFLAGFCRSRRNISSRLIDGLWAKLLPACRQTGRIKYQELSITQINRNHQGKGAALLPESRAWMLTDCF